jgi:hypothetical protein
MPSRFEATHTYSPLFSAMVISAVDVLFTRTTPVRTQATYGVGEPVAWHCTVSFVYTMVLLIKLVLNSRNPLKEDIATY